MARQVNLIVDQGSYWSANIVVYTSNSIGTFTANLYQYANGAGQIRKLYASSLRANLSVDIHPAGSSNLSGTVVLSMNSTTTSGITDGRYVYDVELRGGPAVTGYSDGTEYNNIYRVCEGIITIAPQTTKWDWN